MYFLKNDNRLIRVVIIVLLVLCIVFGGFFGNVSKSYALVGVDDAILIGIVATALIGAGVTFATNSDARAAAEDFIKNCGDDAIHDIVTIAGGINDVLSGKAVFKLTKNLVASFTTWLRSKFNPDNNTITIGSGTFSLVLANGVDYGFLNRRLDIVFNIDANNTLTGADNLSLSDLTLLDSTFHGFKLPGLSFIPYDAAKCDALYFATQSQGHTVMQYWSYNIPSATTTYTKWYDIVGLLLITVIKDGVSYYGVATPKLRSDGSVQMLYPYASCDFSAQAKIMDLPTTGYAPVNSTYFPDSEVRDKALTTDIPLTIPANAAFNGVTADTVRGVSGADADSGTVTGWLQKVWETVKDIPGAIAGGITSVISAIGSGVTTITDTLTNFFNPSGFKLDFSKLKIGLTEVFPFCIPFDFVKGIKTLSSNPDGFAFNIDLHTSYFDIDHTVNLNPFKIPILFFRFIADFWFGYILISRTRDWIKW